MDDVPPTDGSKMPSQRRRISARLLGPAAEITGIDVPPGVVDQRSTYLRVDEPVDVILHLPADRTIQMRVKYVSINVKYGIVVDVIILPLPKAIPFREATAELRRLMRHMAIEPDEQMRRHLATWPDDSGPMTYKTGVKLSHSVNLSVDARPANDNEWFLSLMFSAIGDDRRAIRNPTFKAVPKKSQTSKGG